MLILNKVITSQSTCILLLRPLPYCPQQTFFMLLCDKYFSCIQLFTMDTCASPLTCFCQNTHSWVYNTWSASLSPNTWCVSILTRRPRTLWTDLKRLRWMTIRTNRCHHQRHLSSLFPDVVLPCNLLQSRSWQAQGNSHRGDMQKTTRQH